MLLLRLCVDDYHLLLIYVNVKDSVRLAFAFERLPAAVFAGRARSIATHLGHWLLVFAFLTEDQKDWFFCSMLHGDFRDVLFMFAAQCRVVHHGGFLFEFGNLVTGVLVTVLDPITHVGVKNVRERNWKLIWKL